MLPMAEIRRLLHSPQCAPPRAWPTLRRVPSKPSTELLPHSEVRWLLQGDQHPAKRHCGTGSVCAALATGLSAHATGNPSPSAGTSECSSPVPAATRPALDLGSQLLPPGAVYSMLRSDLSASEAILRDTPARHHQGPRPPRASSSQSAADTLFATLSADMSPLALRPRDPTHMHARCEAWMDCLQHQYAPSTNLADLAAGRPATL